MTLEFESALEPDTMHHIFYSKLRSPQHFALYVMTIIFTVGVIFSQEAEPDSPDSTVYKKYFDPTELMSIFGLVAIGITMVLCTLGGIGGNIMIYPICLIFFQFDAHTAVGHTTILAGFSTFVRFLIEMRNSDKPTVNFDVVMLSTTPCIIGAFFGLIASQVTPGIIIFLLANMLLFFLMVSSYRQYKARALKENSHKFTEKTIKAANLQDIKVPMLSKVALEMAQYDLTDQKKPAFSHPDAEAEDFNPDDEVEEEDQNILEIKEFPISLRRKQSAVIRSKSDTRIKESNLAPPKMQELETLVIKKDPTTKPLHTRSDISKRDLDHFLPKLQTNSQPALAEVLEHADKPEESTPATKGMEDFDPTPASALNNQFVTRTNDRLYFLFLFFVNPLFTFLRGTPELPSFVGYERCGRGDYLMLLIFFSILGYLALYLRRVIIKRNAFIEPNLYNVNFTPENTQKVMLTMLVVGFIGSFLSAGAATVLTFSLIMLKMSPFTASPTSLTITLMYGLSSAMVFYYEGLIYDNAMLFGGIVAILSTAFARLTIYESFVKQGKASYLLLFISVSMVISIAASVLTVAPRIYHQWKNGTNIFRFRSPCS